VHILLSRPDDCAPQISRSIQTDSVPWSRRPTDPGEHVQEVFDLQNLNQDLLRKNKALELKLQQAMQMLGQGREERGAQLSQAVQNMREVTQQM